MRAAGVALECLSMAGFVLLYRIITFKIAGLIWVAYRCLQGHA